MAICRWCYEKEATTIDGLCDKCAESIHKEVKEVKNDNLEKELYKSFITRLIHCTDGAKYEEDIADDYCRFVDEMCAEYKEKFGEEVE